MGTVIVGRCHENRPPTGNNTQNGREKAKRRKKNRVRERKIKKKRYNPIRNDIDYFNFNHQANLHSFRIVSRICVCLYVSRRKLFKIEFFFLFFSKIDSGKDRRLVVHKNTIDKWTNRTVEFRWSVGVFFCYCQRRMERNKSKIVFIRQLYTMCTALLLQVIQLY